MSMLAIFGGEPIRTKPFPVWPCASAHEKQLVQTVLASNGWGIFRGSQVVAFGQKFAQYHGAQYGVPCANGTVALEIQLKALGVGRGDEVITTVFSFVATAAAIANVGAIPIFVDIRDEDYCLDVSHIEEKISQRTKAIIAVHLYGTLCDLDTLSTLATKHRLHLIEDAAQVAGSFWRERGVGTFGVSGSFSFQESKVMTAGEGGIILTNNQEVAEVASMYINCGRSSSTYQTQRRVLGGNYRMTEFQAAVLLGQLERLAGWTDIRESNAQYLTNRLSQIPYVSVVKRWPQVTKQAYYSYVFKVALHELSLPRERFLQALEAEGIPTRRLYVPIYRDPLFVLNAQETPEAWAHYQASPFKVSDYPIAEKASREGMVLWHPLLMGDRDDLDDIVSAIEKVISHATELRDDSQ